MRDTFIPQFIETIPICTPSCKFVYFYLPIYWNCTNLHHPFKFFEPLYSESTLHILQLANPLILQLGFYVFGELKITNWGEEQILIQPSHLLIGFNSHLINLPFLFLNIHLNATESDEKLRGRLANGFKLCQFELFSFEL